jgi:hypothetical protein
VHRKSNSRDVDESGDICPFEAAKAAVSVEIGNVDDESDDDEPEYKYGEHATSRGIGKSVKKFIKKMFKGVFKVLDKVLDLIKLPFYFVKDLVKMPRAMFRGLKEIIVGDLWGGFKEHVWGAVEDGVQDIFELHADWFFDAFPDQWYDVDEVMAKQPLLGMSTMYGSGLLFPGTSMASMFPTKMSYSNMAFYYHGLGLVQCVWGVAGPFVGGSVAYILTCPFHVVEMLKAAPKLLWNVTVCFLEMSGKVAWGLLRTLGDVIEGLVKCIWDCVTKPFSNMFRRLRKIF